MVTRNQNLNHDEDISGTAAAEPGDRAQQLLVHLEDGANCIEESLDHVAISIAGLAAKTHGRSRLADQTGCIWHHTYKSLVLACTFLHQILLASWSVLVPAESTDLKACACHIFRYSK